MGVDTNLSVGPYMIIEGEKEVTITEQIFTCSNGDCEINIKNKNRKGKNNCDQCGSPITNKSFSFVEKKMAKDYFRDADEFKNELCYTDSMCCVGNIFISYCGSPFKKIIYDYRYGDDVIDLTDVNIQEEIDWFKEKYKKIIDYITSEYGEKSVDIRYGVIQWYS